MASTTSENSIEKPLPVEQTQPASEYDDAERSFQPKSPKFWAIIVGVYLAIFLVALDRTIIATAIPRITDEFDSLRDIGWYGTAYMLPAACFTPISGRIYQLYSTKWCFLIAIIIFEVGSVLCAAAPNSITFILGRAVAGFGSAFVFSGVMMIILPLVPLRKRPVFISVFGIAFGVASVIGPIVGGLFTDHITWRWCFYINLPIGGFTLLVVMLFLNIKEPKREKLSLFAQLKRLDPIGMACFVPSIICLILALQWGGSVYSWSSPTIIGLLVTFAVLFIAFAVAQIKLPEVAMAPTRVVLNRSVGGSMLFTFLLAGSMMSIIYYLSVWFQVARGDSAMDAGIHTIPLIVMQVIIGVFSAIFTQKVGYYVPAMIVSPVLCSIGAGLLSTLVPGSTTAQWIGFQVLYGFGIGCGFQNANLSAQNVLPRVDVPIGMAMMFFMQQLGGSVFVTVSQSIFSHHLVDGLTGISGLDAATIVNTGATDVRTIVPPSQIEAVINVYSYSLTRVFIMAACLSACTLIGALALEWKKLPSKAQSQGSTKSSSDSVE